MHLLCLTCGRIGHYKENYNEQIVKTSKHNTEGGEKDKTTRENKGNTKEEIIGSWTVGSKEQKQCKGNETNEGRRNEYTSAGKHGGAPETIWDACH